MRYLIVGAGFAGAVYARYLAEAGHSVTVIDKRDHIGGNAFDFVDNNGVRVHRYGPHLFHTNNEKVVSWLKQFAQWIHYEHRVRASLHDGRCVPLPVNRETINIVFGQRLETPRDAEEFLSKISERIDSPRNAAEHLNSTIGKVLTNLFFRPYTKKMWALDLEDMAATVVQRLPIRFDTDDRYFAGDRFQILPANGYTAVFRAIFDHQNITISLETAYEPGMERDFAHCFNSMPIDEFFGFRLGELPYRSIRFHPKTRPFLPAAAWTVTNFTDDGPFTRETTWHGLPGHHIVKRDHVTTTIEEPCDYKENNFERYYPVKMADNRYGDLYKQYRALSLQETKVSFIGRCGTYQYLDMHQVINQSMADVTRFLLGRL